jgi:hypothetical protein
MKKKVEVGYKYLEKKMIKYVEDYSDKSQGLLADVEGMIMELKRNIEFSGGDFCWALNNLISSGKIIVIVEDEGDILKGGNVVAKRISFPKKRKV